MATFPILELEALIQVGDKTRLDATKSFVSHGAAISKVEVRPKAADAFIDVTGTKYLDWAYDTAGTHAVTVKVTAGLVETEATKAIEAISALDDALFSADSDLTAHEADILKFVPKGKASFLNVHRRAQALVLAWLDRQGYVGSLGEKLTKEHLLDSSEVKDWSTFIALRLIFEGLSNATDDVFSEKAVKYQKLEDLFRDRAILRLDLNLDGEINLTEATTLRSAIVVRR